ncbi:MAG TPA: hypothetical protein VGO63_00505 [Candidatus Paceibacterota bacterium]|nr:hypothetical protein [Candidatus Paceibacterota bacterium]
MKKFVFLFTFVLLLAALPGIAQTNFEPLTADGCDRAYHLHQSQDLSKVFGSKWDKKLSGVNPNLKGRVEGNMLQKVYEDDVLCLPPGVQPKEEIAPGLPTMDSMRPGMVLAGSFSKEREISQAATMPLDEFKFTPIITTSVAASGSEDESGDWTGVLYPIGFIALFFTIGTSKRARTCLLKAIRR